MSEPECSDGLSRLIDTPGSGYEILPESQCDEPRPRERSIRALDGFGLVLSAIVTISSAAGLAVSRGAGGVLDMVPVAVFGWTQLVSAAAVSLVAVAALRSWYVLTRFERVVYGAIMVLMLLVAVWRLVLIVSGSGDSFT